MNKFVPSERVAFFILMWYNILNKKCDLYIVDKWRSIMGLFDFFKSKQSSKDVKESLANTAPNSRKAQVQVVNQTEEVPSLESRLQNCTPSKMGLYPHEIIMLDYAHTYKTNGNTFQAFWKFKYSVLKPQSVLDSLLRKGFIKVGSVRGCLEKLKVSEIKDLLINANQKTTGKKSELIERVFDCYSSDSLEKMFKERYYELTDIGKVELSENEYVSYLHRHDYMSVWDMNYYLHNDNPSHLGYRDIIWREFNKQSMKHFKSWDFGLYRCIRLNMHSFLMEESKYESAMHHLLEVVAFDLSGLGNGEKDLRQNPFLKDKLVEFKMVNFLFEDNEVILPPGIVNYMKKLHDVLNMTDDEFRQYVYEDLATIKIHEQVFSSE